jgi:hypothetical protein
LMLYNPPTRGIRIFRLPLTSQFRWNIYITPTYEYGMQRSKAFTRSSTHISTGKSSKELDRMTLSHMSENMHIEIFPKATWFSQEKNNFQRSTRPRATTNISSLFWQAGIIEKQDVSVILPPFEITKRILFH